MSVAMQLRQKQAIDAGARLSGALSYALTIDPLVEGRYRRKAGAGAPSHGQKQETILASRGRDTDRS